MIKFRVKRQRLGGGASEVAVYGIWNELIAVITHPCRGAKWFLHRAGSHVREKFPTLKAALAAVGVTEMAT